MERELRGVRTPQRLEREGVVGAQSAAPRGSRVEQLRPREGQEQNRKVVQACGQELDQVEERRVRPVDVLEDERRSLVPRARLDEDTHRLEETLAIGHRRLRLEPEQDRKVSRDGLGLLLPDESFHERAQLSGRHLDVVAVEDAGELLNLRREGAARAALPIGQAAAADDPAAAGRDALRELRREPRLADPGGAEHGDEVRVAFELHALPGRVEEADLPAAPDERRGRQVSFARGRGRRHGAPGFERYSFPLCRNRLERLVFDRCARGSVRLVADDDLADRRVLLQARRGVHDVAGDHRLAERGPRRERDDRLAGVYGATNTELELRLLHVECGHRVADGESRPNGALGIVAMGGRRAEDGHDGVADELLHDPAKGLQLVAHRPVIRRQDRAHVLRIELLRARREAHEVDEDDADEPALLAPRRLLLERSSAREAETGDLRVVLAAGTASGHSLILAALRLYSNGSGLAEC